MRFGVFAVSLAVLAGCQTKQIEEMSYSEQMAVAEQIVQRCIAQGVPLNTPQFDACNRAESQREVFTRRQNLANARRAQSSIAGGLQTQANVYNNAASANQSTNCRSVRAPDGAVRTTCN